MKKTSRWVLAGLLLYCMIFTLDYVKASQDQAPIFAIKTVTYKDGGTKVYLGLGYKIIQYHVIDGRQDSEFGSWLLQYDNTK